MTNKAHYASVPFILVLVACGGSSTQSEVPVRPGLDVLLSDSIHLVRDVSIGIITNHSGLSGDGRHGVDLLIEAGVEVAAIFSPEHGYRGTEDREDIEDGVDPATGLPIYSLYGDTREPTVEMLDGLDKLVIDLQDIGARPYTYVSTALLAMRAASRAGIDVVVLDRPNPISGTIVQGPVLDTALASFVGMLPLPLRHGATFAELVRFGNDQLGISARLTVVPIDGWRRDMWFDDTGLPWVRPSPNMPDLESATHYPGLVIFEATNISVGRGTPMAFQLLGAPWLNAAGLAAAFGQFPGVELRDTSFVPVDPGDSKFPGQTVAGIRLRVTDRDLYDPVSAAVRLFDLIRREHPQLNVNHDRLAARLGNRDLEEESEGSATLAIRNWQSGIAAFREQIRPYLVYSE